MESVLEDLLERCTRRVDLAESDEQAAIDDALTAHRQLRSALRKSAKAAKIATQGWYFSRMYDEVLRSAASAAVAPSPAKGRDSSDVDLAATRSALMAEHVFSCATICEARVAGSQSVADLHADAHGVLRNLCTLAVSTLGQATATLSDCRLRSDLPDEVLVRMGVALQSIHVLVRVAVRAQDFTVWRAVIGELGSLDVASYLAETIDVLTKATGVFLPSRARTSAAGETGLPATVVAPLAVALRCCTRVYHASYHGAGYRERALPSHAPLVQLLSRCLLRSELIFSLAKLAANDDRIAIPVADALVDTLAVATVRGMGAASVPQPTAQVAESARAAGVRMRHASASKDACVREVSALMTAALAAEQWAAGVGMPLSAWIGAARNGGSGAAVGDLCAAAGEWHCALAWAAAILDKAAVISNSNLISIAAPTRGAEPIMIFSTIWDASCRSDEAQLRVAYRTSANPGQSALSCTLHQWFCDSEIPRNLPSNGFYISTFGEPFPKSGRVNHSKILRASAFEIGASPHSDSAAFSDGAPATKVQAKSGQYETASGSMGRGSYVTLTNQLQAIEHWRMDFGLQLPVTEANVARECRFVICGAVQATEATDLRFSLKNPAAAPASALDHTPRPGDAPPVALPSEEDVPAPMTARGTGFTTALESLADVDMDAPPPPQPSVARRLDDKPCLATPGSAPKRSSVPNTSSDDDDDHHGHPANSSAVLKSATKEDRTLLDNVTLQREVDRLTHERDELFNQCATLRHESTLVDELVVAPLLQEVSHLRQLCMQYEAALEAASKVIATQERSAESALKEATSLHEEAGRLYSSRAAERSCDAVL